MNAPIVNVNGTCLRDLVRQKLELSKAYHRLWDALLLAAPHGRDYPDGEASFRVARAQHQAEMDRVWAKAKEAMDDALALAAQSGDEDWRQV